MHVPLPLTPSVPPATPRSFPHLPPRILSLSKYYCWHCWMMRRPLGSSRFITHLMPWRAGGGVGRRVG